MVVHLKLSCCYHGCYRSRFPDRRRFPGIRVFSESSSFSWNHRIPGISVVFPESPSFRNPRRFGIPVVSESPPFRNRRHRLPGIIFSELSSSCNFQSLAPLPRHFDRSSLLYNAYSSSYMRPPSALTRIAHLLPLTHCAHLLYRMGRCT